MNLDAYSSFCWTRFFWTGVAIAFLSSRLQGSFFFLVNSFFKANKRRVLLDNQFFRRHEHWVVWYIRSGSLDHIIIETYALVNEAPSLDNHALSIPTNAPYAWPSLLDIVFSFSIWQFERKAKNDCSLKMSTRNLVAYMIGALS